MNNELKYYCDNCAKEVRPILRRFDHPHTGHLGSIAGDWPPTGYICPDCHKPVRIIDDEEVSA